MEIPGHGLVEGEWDLREGYRSYLGGVDFAGKRVLELGTASGFLCFCMERQGAEVVAYDLSEREVWDIVPYAERDFEKLATESKAHIQRLNNGFWFAHRAFGSKARVVHGSIYNVPAQIGPVDIATFTSVLLHVRDPFLALSSALRLTQETVIVTERPPRKAWATRLLSRISRPCVQFVPDRRRGGQTDTWWRFSPEALLAFLAVLGFGDGRITYHQQLLHGRRRPLYTIVARRTASRA
jgi:hypothetical protein